jgi:hypothetical protein
MVLNAVSEFNPIQLTNFHSSICLGNHRFGIGMFVCGGVSARDVSDFRFFPLLELPKFKINKNKFLCSSDVPIFGLQSTHLQ